MAASAAASVAPSQSQALSTTKWSAELFTHAPLADDITKMGLKLTVIGLDGKEHVFSLDDKIVKPPIKYERFRDDLPARKDTFGLDLPVGFEPAAVKILNLPNAGAKIFFKGGKHERIFVRQLRLHTSSSDINILANSYVSPNQGERLFVRDDAWSDPKLRTNEVISTLQETELQEIRGEGRLSSIANKERVPGDRIYQFATYNDLGKDPKDPKNLRNTLGGTTDFPYPRRLATNRPPYPNTQFESAAKGSGVTEQLMNLLGLKAAVLPSPWVPEDDNFSAEKSAGFLGYGLLDQLPAAISQLGGVFTGPGKVFDSISEVLSLYDQASLNPKEGDEVKNYGSLISKLIGPASPKLSVRTGVPNSPSKFEPIDLLKFDVPKCLTDRLPTWATDKEFGRFFLAGLNPVVLESVDSPAKLGKVLAGSAIKDTDIKNLLEGQSFEELAKEAEEGKEPRLFVVDYSSLLGLLAFMNKEAGIVQHAGRAVLFRRSDGHLVPVSIELTSKQDKAPTVFTANDPNTLWLLGKLLFLSVDTGYHQLISHWLRTHACVEPYLIALRRQLSPTHPIFKLLMPHFKYTLPINAAARTTLVNGGGLIEGNFTPGPFCMSVSAKVYGLTWQFKNEGLLADLKKRGFLDASGNLNVKDYPYAEDGLLIWNALNQYFTEYVDYYYQSDEDVKKDKQINAWWKDVRENGHPDVKTGWVELTGKASLVEIVSTIAWVASAHHAAVNFGQYDYTAWILLHATLCRKAVPDRGSKDWEELANLDVYSANYQKAYEKLLLAYMPTPKDAAVAMTIVKLLSAHAEDEQYLSAGPERLEWLPLDHDPKLMAIFTKFVDTVKEIDSTIDNRNEDPANVSRHPLKDGLPYTLLRPTSETPGVTFKGVPYSISI